MREFVDNLARSQHLIKDLKVSMWVNQMDCFILVLDGKLHERISHILFPLIIKQLMEIQWLSQFEFFHNPCISMTCWLVIREDKIWEILVGVWPSLYFHDYYLAHGERSFGWSLTTSLLHCKLLGLESCRAWATQYQTSSQLCLQSLFFRY